MKFSKNKKIFFIILLALVLFGVGLGGIEPAQAQGETNDIGTGIFGDLISMAAVPLMYIAKVLGYLLGYIAGLFLALCGYLIELALNINMTILVSPIVQTGWQVVLNFTNLGFILAIIVIAFSTIFRVQSYAMKQVIWKVVVAALLVNFSLTIAGAFINISDNLSNFFIEQSGIESPEEWAKSFSGVFEAQRLLEVSSEKIATQQGNAATAAINDLSASVLAFTAAPFFIALFTALAGITLFAVFIMLLIRYVYLGLLLILSPIVWLLWIFPGTSGLWKKWWSNFIKWTFFAPIMLFFMSLAIYAMQNEPQVVKDMVSKNSAAAANVNLTFGAGVIGEMVIAIGLVMGGLIAANSMGIAFASTAMNAATNVNKAFGSWVGRKALAGTGGRIMGSEGMKNLTQNLSSSKFAGFRLMGTGLNKLGATVETTLKKPYQEQTKNLSDERLNNEILNTKGVGRTVFLAEAAKRRAVNKRVQDELLSDPKTMESLNKDFKRNSLNFNDVEKAIGRNIAMTSAGTDEKALQEATNEFIKTLGPKDYDKVQWGDIFKETQDENRKRIQQSFAGSFALFENGAYAKIASKLKTQDHPNFSKVMHEKLDQLEKEGYESIGFKEDKDIESFADRLAKARERLNKTLDRRAMFGGESEGPQPQQA